MYTFYSHDFICRQGIIVWECLNLKGGSRRQIVLTFICNHKGWVTICLWQDYF